LREEDREGGWLSARMWTGESDSSLTVMVGVCILADVLFQSCWGFWSLEVFAWSLVGIVESGRYGGKG
jgi:cytochrome b